VAEAAGAGAIRAIVLDFNGTLAQDGHLTAPLYVDTFASVGVPLTVEDYHRELALMPDREAFTLALARLNAATGADTAIEPGQTVAVEDATGGAPAARAAGIRVAAIRGPGYAEASRYADLVIERLDLAALDLILGAEPAEPAEPAERGP
jgi:beta-phosphoglucomutase-like phosphatase (HAD superfamily)